MDFQYRNIRIRSEINEIKRNNDDYNFKDNYKIDRFIKTHFSIFDFSIMDRDLTGYTYIKSILSNYISYFWKRSGHSGNTIFIEHAIIRGENKKYSQLLYFSARQKDSNNSLLIAYEDCDSSCYGYFNIHEVTMLENAIGKAIGLIGPSKPAIDAIRTDQNDYYNRMDTLNSTKYICLSKKLDQKKFKTHISQ